MLKRLHRHLTLLYTTTIGIILTAVIAGLYLLMTAVLEQQQRQNFQSVFDSVVSYVNSRILISNTWISEKEASKKVVFYLEDNGVPLSYSASWMPSGKKRDLITAFRQMAEQDGFSPAPLLSSSRPLQSPIYKITQKPMDSYYGAAANFPSPDGYKFLILFQSARDDTIQKIQLLLLFVLIDALSIFILCLVCRKLVGLSLKPVSESRRKQTEFIAAASHELRSPLSVITTHVQALMLDGSEKEQFLPAIYEECGRMKQLIDDMLLLASSDAGTWKIDKSVLDADTFFIELYDRCAPLCAAKNHTLLLEFSDDPLPEIRVDRQRLFQVLGILIDNALSYSRPGSPIHIRPSFQAKNHMLVIQVIDHGTGIPDADKKRIFDRFFRSDRSRTSGQHYGLGLSIANELISLHHGRISLSDTNGGGCAFCIELPVSPPPPLKQVRAD